MLPLHTCARASMCARSRLLRRPRAWRDCRPVLSVEVGGGVGWVGAWCGGDDDDEEPSRTKRQAWRTDR